MVKIQFVSKASKKDSVWVTPFFEKEIKKLSPFILEAIERKPHDTAVEIFIQEGKNLNHFIALRLGLKKGSTKNSRELSGAALFKKFQGILEKTAILDIRDFEEEGLDLITGFLFSGWRFDKHRTIFKPEEISSIEKIEVLCCNPDELKKRFLSTHALIDGVFFARALTSEPANILYPEAYVKRLQELEKEGVEVEVLSHDQLMSIGMTGLLAVGKGSSHSPFVVVMRWNGLKQKSAPTVLIGKGVCFDSGGICLKPADEQFEMKWDKAGAGVVAGLMKALAMQKSPCHVVGIAGLVENMPDGKAMKPGDVIRTMSGQTVEIADTDAEGRLVLADCLWYAEERFKPKVMIDLGTLTIETIASLGQSYAGLYSNSSALTKELKKAGEACGEEVWELPMGAAFAKQIESTVADIKNVGLAFCGENAAAAEFLKRFVRKTPWAHIDIAGVSWSKDDLPLCAKGVTGWGVRLLAEWLNKCYSSSS